MNKTIWNLCTRRARLFSLACGMTALIVVGTPTLADGPAPGAPTLAKSASSGLPPAIDAQGDYHLNLADPAIRSAIEAQGGQIVNEGPDQGLCVKIAASVPAAGVKPGLSINLPFDIVPYHASKVAVIANVRAQNVSVPLHRYTGIKVQLFVQSPSIGNVYIDRQGISGTFDWKEISAMGMIPADGAKSTLNLGLQECSGTIWLSDVRIHVAAKPPVRPPPVAVLKQHSTQWRGVMGPSKFAAKDFADMAAWHVNIVRWNFPFYMMHGKEADPVVYEAWLKDQLNQLQSALDAAQANGIKICIDLHQPPGGRVGDGTFAMLLDKGLQDTFVANWERIARRFKDHPAVWAYDIINEPVQNQAPGPGCDDWLGIQVRAAKAVRAIDAKTPICIEMDEWDDASPYALMKPVDVPNVIYEVHMYWPPLYTHQGVHTDQGQAKDVNSNIASLVYPGMIGGMNVNKEMLRARLQPVRDFQKAYNVRIFVGEFSAVRWAPGAATYIDDLISIYEEYGWDWAYHAFRNWPGWSVEHADLPYDRDHHPLATTPTDREIVLKKWLALNQRDASKTTSTAH